MKDDNSVEKLVLDLVYGGHAGWAAAEFNLAARKRFAYGTSYAGAHSIASNDARPGSGSEADRADRATEAGCVGNAEDALSWR